MPTNLKDVALRAGVSTATVSCVLQNKGYVTDANRQEVLRALHELDYRMNAVAWMALFKRLLKQVLWFQISVQLYPMMIR